jgi:hypothetical protein
MEGDKCSSAFCNNIATETCAGCEGKGYCSHHMQMHGHIITGLKLVNLVIRIKDDDSNQDGKKDINYYDRASSQIQQEIKKFAVNLMGITYSSGTNVITLSANWPRDNLRYMVNRILKIKEVDGLLMFPRYIEELKDAVEMHDFFKVTALSSTLLESYGKQILIKHFVETNKEIGHERIGGLSFDATAIMLYYCGIIDKDLFKNINDVKKKRNRFIHEMSNPALIKLLSKERLEDMENLANMTIHSVSELEAKLDEKN